MKSFDIIIPIFNESECIQETLKRVENVCTSLASQYQVRVVFVDDGSTDDTYTQLSNSLQGKEHFRIIKLSRNFGHQIALTAGLDYSSADYVGILDGDLQDPPELLPEMLKKCEEGFHIVYGQRMERDGETLFKLFSAALFYRILSRFCDVEIPKDTGDFRVISFKVLTALKSMRERHRFIRGLVPFSGFKSFAFSYKRNSRYAGETKYPFSKMTKFALDAIFSFSIKPIKIMRYFGLFSISASLVYFIYVLYLRVFVGGVVPGFTVLIFLSIFFGGIQILSMSLLGEYIGRIFEEVKGRPLYFVEMVFNETR